MHSGTEWTDALCERLRALWAEGLSGATIGGMIGVSRNAVLGKAHRLRLTARPSPIKPLPPGAERRRRRRVKAPQLAALLRLEGPGIVPTAPHPLKLLRPPEPPRQPREWGPLRAGASCQWPFGEPRTPGFRFCGDASVIGRPYCPVHCDVAYVPIRDRREDDLAEAA